jgi:predicted GNAT family N-acyltransferase
MHVELFDVNDRARLGEALALRTAVFVDEQGVPPEEEIDDYDRPGSTAVHALVTGDDGVAIGAARFYAQDTRTVRIGRMAVAASARGRGAGSRLLSALADEARRLGYERAHLHAQVHAREFYLRAGYTDDGERLWDAGIDHQPMTKVFGPQ